MHDGRASLAPSGLIAAFDLREHRTLTADWGRAWSAVDTVPWLHFDRKSAATATWLREDSALDAVVVDELLAESTRPGVMAAGTGVLLTLRGVNLNPGADPEDMISIRLWTDARRVISLQGPRLLAIDTLLAKLRAGEGPKSVGGLLLAMISGLTDRMGPVIEQINATIDEFEDKVIAPDQTVPRLHLIQMRQRIITLHRYLLPQAVALRELNANDLAPYGDEFRDDVAQQINRVVRYIEDLEAAKGRSVVIQDELANQLTELANERIYAVTIIAAIFLPLTLVSGLLGMNVGGIPLAANPLGFLSVTVGSAVVGVVGYWILRRSRWL